MKKFTFVAVLLTSFLLLANRSHAQDYKTAVGIKFGGYENGPSIKYFMNSNTALEGILGIRNHGLVVTGLYEIHQPAFNTPKLKFYYGFGAHVGAVGSGIYKRFGDDNYYSDSRVLLGADAVLGLEYKLPDAPIAFSLDLNPRVELATGPFFDLAPGLGLKYTF
ncbi:hypothetical protein EWM62_08870 [Mucilaginibacter terrigena]|uniref:Outer membrane protein beta-barrel domain-containing protein n=1 Tax=Mucilaginibacter terrigena TaxID=2492395 RepID=A0A4Q5LM59_9SPHI|nr:hypothetical protein [Mucilaginibacter terrigena]RYU90746.1 hypothetical protein EWM62_08870 [Mucilaginibacter terrigena]